ncbi:MAG: (2Fe-2S)-binding protein [Thermoleophilia bacterium]|nr:(2Fe-2S)-binding protein [Thermoleophilia bacterium]
MADYAPVDLTAGEQVTFELNGRKVTAPAGTMLVDACFAHGVEIPIFCYEPRIGPPVGACRMCLVEVEGMRGLQTACSTPVAPDMVVRTTTPAVKEAQDGVLELLLANHPLDCPVCDKGGECPLQDRTFKFGPGKSRFVEPKRHYPKPLELSRRIALDRERCIACYRCVRFSQDVAQDGELTMQERGARSEITTFTGDDYDGRFTGNIIDICPVGALTSIPYRFVSRPWDIANTPSVCGLCPVGCNTELTVREDQVKRVTGRPDPNHAVEEGWICDKGRWGYDALHSAARITTATVREQYGDRPSSLEDGVAAAASLLAGRRVGILVGGDATVEEAGIALDLVGGAIPGAIVGRTGIPGGGLGALRALPGAQLGDIDDADVIVLVGGDPANQQPIAELRLRKAARFGATVTGCGPRAHALESLGTFHRTAPGDLTAGITAVREQIAHSTAPVILWDEADLAADPAAAAALAEAVAANPAALQLELGHQVNGAGLRAMGLRAGNVLDAVAGQEIDVLVCVHADPLGEPGRSAWSDALERFTGQVITISAFTSATTQRADLVLPALSMWEQAGTLVSMTGRAQRLRPGSRGPAEAAAGWEILIAVAHHLGHPPAYRTAEAAYRHVTDGVPAFAGVGVDDIGTFGAVIDMAAAQADGATAATGASDGDGVPLVLTRWMYGDTATARSHALREEVRAPVVELGPATAERLWVKDGEHIVLRSASGDSDPLPVLVTDGTPEGVVFAPLGAPGAPVEGAVPVDQAPTLVAVTRAEVTA